MTAPLLPSGAGPRRLTQETSVRTEGLSSLRIGIVTNTSGVMVSVAGGSVAAGRLASYSPSVGDVVALVAVQDSWLILGEVVG